jgi:hypothetical protein
VSLAGVARFDIYATALWLVLLDGLYLYVNTQSKCVYEFTHIQLVSLIAIYPQRFISAKTSPARRFYQSHPTKRHA